MEKKSREGETFVTALINRLTEAKKTQAVGYNRDLVISIPKNIVDTHPGAQQVLLMSGKISRTPELNLKVDLEQSTTDGLNRERVKLLDLVFHITSETDLDGAISLLEK